MAGLLRDHDFRRLFEGDLASQLSTQILMMAMPLVAVVALDAPEFQVGVLTALSTAAFLVVGLPAGAWVDRMRRRNVLIVSDIGRAIALASIPIAWWIDALTIWQLYVVAAGVGVMTVFFDVAYQSYLPFLVGRDNVVEANARLEAIRATTQLGGPTAAGWLVQWATAPFAIIGNVAGFAISAWRIARIRGREARPQLRPGARLRTEIAEGLRFVVSNRLLRSIALCTGSFNLCMSAFTAMEMVFFARVLELSPGAIGMFFSIGAVGGLLGALVTDRLARRVGQGPLIWMSVAFTSPFMLAAPLAEPGFRFWLAAAAWTVVSFGTVTYNVSQVSFRQRLTPDPLLGRMNATMRFLVWGTMPLGGLIGGALGQTLGARSTLLIAAGGACLAFLPIYFSPLRKMQELPGAHLIATERKRPNTHSQ